MSGIPFATPDKLKQFHERCCPQSILNKFIIMDLEGMAITSGIQIKFTGKHIIDTIVNQSKLVLFTNFTLDGTACSYTFGTRQLRKVRHGNDTYSIYCWKTLNGYIFMRKNCVDGQTSNEEIMVYITRDLPLYNAYPQSLTVNQQYTFGANPAPEFNFYHNGLPLNTGTNQIDGPLWSAMNTCIWESSADIWSTCTSGWTNMARLEWEDGRNTWASKITTTNYRLDIK